MSNFSFTRYRRRSDSDYEYLLDGDEYLLLPGEDFGTINAFRVRLHRMTRSRGLRYATKVVGDQLAVVIFRERPGDMFTEDADGFRGPSRAQ